MSLCFYVCSSSGRRWCSPSAAIRELLGDIVIRLRKARGLTQVRLAAAWGVRVGYIGDIERAAINVTLASLQTVAVGLHCALVDLFHPRPTPADRRED